MKKNIFLLVSFLSLLSINSLAQEVVLIYEETDGNESLKLKKDAPAYLFKPVQDNSYYLYTNSSVIRFDLSDEANRKDKFIDIVCSDDDKSVWHYKSDSVPTKHKKQPFETVDKLKLFIKRDVGRPRSIVKDQISVGNLKCYIWNPLQGTVDFSANINNIEYHTNDTIHVKAGEIVKIKLHAKKNGDGIIIQNLFSGDSLLTAGEPIDEITNRNTKFEPSFEKSFPKDGKSFSLSFNYQILDEEFRLVNKKEEIYVCVDTDTDTHSSISTWLLLLLIIVVGGTFLIICIIRSSKRKQSNNHNFNPGILVRDENEKWAWFEGDKANETIIRTKPINIASIYSIVVVRSCSIHPKKDWQKGKRDQFFKIIAEVDNNNLERIKKDIIKKRGQNVKIISSITSSDVQLTILNLKNNFSYPIELVIEKQDEIVLPNSNLDNDAPARIALLEKKLEETKTELDKVLNELSNTKKDLESKKAKLISYDSLFERKDAIISSKEIKIEQLEREKKTLNAQYNDIKDSLGKEIEEHGKTRIALDLAETQANEKIARAELECQNTIHAKENECAIQIESIQRECDSRTIDWKADKEFFLEKICTSVERLYGISDEISSNIEGQDKFYNESFEYIVSSLFDFSEKVKCSASESGDWRKVTNAEAEQSIVSELTELIRNNSSWINSIARLYCYSRISEIGAVFEENGVRIQDIDSVYRDMCFLLGVFGINIVVPRILVDYYDEINKKYFTYNNEDIIITRFAGRDILIQNKETLKIYDMGKVAYYLNGKITKGEIVHF